MSMKRPTAASKDLPSGIWVTSLCTKLTLRSPVGGVVFGHFGDRMRVLRDVVEKSSYLLAHSVS